jgi:flagellar biosynthesis component FlhA
MHSIQVKVKSEVLRNLNNIKMDAQEVKNLIDFGNPTEKAITEDFTADHLEASGVYDLVSTLEDDIKTLKMLLNLLK